MVTRLYVDSLKTLKGLKIIPRSAMEIWQKIKLIKAFMHVLEACKNVLDPIKVKSLEWPQHFSVCKSVGIFPDGEGQVTPQSMIRSDQASNSFETLWLCSLPARMKKIQSKVKALEWLQDNILIVQLLKGR